MTKEETEKLAEEFIRSRPMRFLKDVNATNAGIGLVLKLLHISTEGKLTAGDISESMGVSTARVAVLLKKMEKKGLIVKESDKTDARVTVVCLSEEGRKKASEMQRNMLERISTVIDKLGEDKFRQFIALSVEFKEAMGDGFPPKPDI